MEVSSTTLFANIGFLYVEGQMAKTELSEAIVEKDRLKSRNEMLEQENRTLRTRLQGLQEEKNNGPTAG